MDTVESSGRQDRQPPQRQRSWSANNDNGRKQCWQARGSQTKEETTRCNTYLAFPPLRADLRGHRDWHRPEPSSQPFTTANRNTAFGCAGVPIVSDIPVIPKDQTKDQDGLAEAGAYT